ncbi:immunity protein Imm33 domain-containing protein [Rhizosphaericola mali]|uniref:DUF2185 domain-containing protein n=1 Tax=Rhizosphaericola mali TaxID=2545455 RepID=A0A5P2G7C1_9BACT|nr:DUF2185 domain-containing protein [Rhizosphaericola mali]QES87411.1 DUF2185 domain-containing protein [Rhizosphaericola mali]
MYTLSQEVAQKIDELAIEGNQLMDDKQDYNGAIGLWKQALTYIPTPQEQYNESIWLEASIGDAYFQSKDYANALFHLKNALENRASNAENNPFIMLRLGQVYFENNSEEWALHYLHKAFQLEKEDIFKEEEKKYFNFLMENIEIEEVSTDNPHYLSDFSDFPHIGGLIVSKMVIESKIRPQFMYREKPMNPKDSGWRIFSGQESDEYTNDPNNSGIYNPSTLLQIDPSIAALLLKGIGSVFERITENSDWHGIHDFKLDSDYLISKQLTQEWSFDINNLFESKLEEDGSLYFTTGDKSVRLIIWDDLDNNETDLYKMYKTDIENRDQTMAPTLELFEFSEDVTPRIGYRIKESDNYKSYDVIYGFSIAGNEIVQSVFYYDEEDDKNWALETWKSLHYKN